MWVGGEDGVGDTESPAIQFLAMNMDNTNQVRTQAQAQAGSHAPGAPRSNTFTGETREGFLEVAWSQQVAMAWGTGWGKGEVYFSPFSVRGLGGRETGALNSILIY